jgi:Kef-type K+ transport system membrane component KefB
MAGSFSESLPILASLHEDRVFAAITDLGVFFLMLLAGIEMRPKELAEVSSGSLPVALSAMIVPLGLGFAVTWAWLPVSEYRFAQALFVGTGLAITAVPVAVRVLMDLGQLETRFGRMVISAAVVDDVLSLVLLAVLTAVVETGGFPDTLQIGLLVGKVVLFFAITIAVGHYVLPWLGRRLKRLLLDELEFSALLIVAMAFALLAETLGMHFIMGAFIAGLFFGRRTIDEHVYEDVKRKVSGITTGFLAPVFFASIGLHLETSAITMVPTFLIVLLVIAFFGKMLGAGVPALWAGLSRRESFALGTAMSARGAVELVVAGIALRAGLFSLPEPPPPVVKYLFSSIVIVAVVTTLVVPVLLRMILSRSDHPDEPDGK